MKPLGTVYAALMAAHDLGDHVVQTDDQAAHKAQAGPAGWEALAGHVGGYTAVQIVALRAVGVRFWRWRTLVGVAFSAATHAFLDRRWPVKWILEHTGSAKFAAPAVRVIGEQVDAMGRLRPGSHRLLQSEGPLPIHGPYLADQALHHACLFIAARIISGGDRG